MPRRSKKPARQVWFRVFGCGIATIGSSSSAIVAWHSDAAALGTEREVAVLHSYEAPGDCPGATAFMDHFSSRTQRVRITSSSVAAHLSLVVTLSHEDGQVVGKLAIRGRGGVTSQRVVSAQSCDEVVPALAFVAALAADPSARAAPIATTSRGTPAVTASNASASKTPSASSAPSQVQQASGVAAPAVIAPRRPENPTQLLLQKPLGDKPEERWRWSLAGQLGASSGPYPKWSPLGALFVHMDVPPSVWGTHGGIVSFGFVGALPSEQDTHPGSVEFLWLAAATGICPIVIGLSDQWSTAPCITGELGLLRGVASGISIPAARTRWWRAVGAAVQLRWAPRARYFVQSDATVTSPLARDDFGIVNEGQFASVHEVPWIVGRVGLGVGVFL